MCYLREKNGNFDAHSPFLADYKYENPTPMVIISQV